MQINERACFDAGFDAELVLLPGLTPGPFQDLNDDIQGLVVQTVIQAEQE